MDNFFGGVLNLIFWLFIINLFGELFLGISLLSLARKLGYLVWYRVFNHKERTRNVRRAKKAARTKLRVSTGKVYHVNSLDGRTRIVQAKTEKEAMKIAAKNMAVEEDDLVAEEVYGEVLRK